MSCNGFREKQYFPDLTLPGETEETYECSHGARCECMTTRTLRCAANPGLSAVVTKLTRGQEYLHGVLANSLFHSFFPTYPSSFLSWRFQCYLSLPLLPWFPQPLSLFPSTIINCFTVILYLSFHITSLSFFRGPRLRSRYSDYAKVRWSNPGRGEIFRTRADRPWGPPSHLHSGYRVFPGGKAAGA